MQSKRQFLTYAINWLGGTLLTRLAVGDTAQGAIGSSTDPRPEFASGQLPLVLEFYFGSTAAADDATITIEAPLVSASKELVPFRISAPGAEKLIIVVPENPQPLVLAMDQIHEPVAVVSGRARLHQSGELACYILRNGRIGRASRRINLSGHWENN